MGKFLPVMLNGVKILNQNVFKSLTLVLLFVEDVLGSGEFDEGHEVVEQAEHFGGLLVVLVQLE